MKISFFLYLVNNVLQFTIFFNSFELPCWSVLTWYCFSIYLSLWTDLCACYWDPYLIDIHLAQYRDRPLSISLFVPFHTIQFERLLMFCAIPYESKNYGKNHPKPYNLINIWCYICYVLTSGSLSTVASGILFFRSANPSPSYFSSKLNCQCRVTVETHYRLTCILLGLTTFL